MTYYFYDLETSGRSGRRDRIMQFAGQRTDMDLKPVGKPHNLLVKLSDDVLPEPGAVLVHGITPQKSRADGVSEVDFLKFFTSEVFQPGTIMTGFNNIRFDDEFLRFTMWRNFYDAYEWQWKENCSRWDLLDVSRMTRALRPEGIKWPFASDGKPTVSLPVLAAVNGLQHDSAHDALSDVQALVGLARLLRSKQPKLFDYLLSIRQKTKVEALVAKGEPFIYVSGRYPNEYEKASVAVALAPHPQGRGMFVYDLRTDPADFIDLSSAELMAKWSDRDREAAYFPVKLLTYNRCPAIAPLGVLDVGSQKRLKLDLKIISRHAKKLAAAERFAKNIVAAADGLYPAEQPQLVIDEQRVDEQLYDGFIDGADKTKMSVVRAASPKELSGLKLDFSDDRLKLLLPLYKARNYPNSLSVDERLWWEAFRAKRLLGGGDDSPASRYFRQIEELNQQKLKPAQKLLLEELEIYGQSILPLAD